jgi:uncharacterized membrane protein
MIEAHVLDAWTLPADRSTDVYGYLTIVGGMAAPMFLWLAGLSLVLGAQRACDRTGDRDRAGKAAMRRGVQIFLLAFLFRLQAFIVSPGNPLVSLLRVDILNIMGPSMIGAAFLWRFAGGARAAGVLCASAAVALAMATPPIRAIAWPGWVPALLQWYLSPAGNHSTFTLFPWAGFLFAGAAFGSVLGAAERRAEGRTLGWFALVGSAVAGLSYYASTLPSIYETASFWTTSPTYFGVRVGLVMMWVAGLFALTPLARWTPRPFGVLGRFGTHSLFIYWIHVELVYGYASALVHHSLPLWATLIAFVAFSGLMYRAIDLREHVLTWWKAQPGRAAAETFGV